MTSMLKPSSIVIRSVCEPGERYLHFFLTAPAFQDPAEAYRRLAEQVRASGLEPLSEKTYGTLKIRSKVLEARRSAFRDLGLDADLPLTYLEGRPAAGGEFAGVQLWGIARQRVSDPGVRSVPVPGGTARLWETPGFRLLHVPSILGAAGLPPHAQARSMFARALEAARAHGFPYRNAVRTWIYLRRILDWYEEFNQARNALYARPEFLGGEASLFPASTGIQGRAGEEECLMDALFFSSAGAAAARRVQKTARQEASCAYGSAFSRGACLEFDGRRLVHVSGTASIGPDGESLHRGDAAAQSRETLDAVSAVLGTEGAGLGDIAMSTLFCKDQRAYEAWHALAAREGGQGFPMIAVLADVCRPELLVELEALAVV